MDRTLIIRQPPTSPAACLYIEGMLYAAVDSEAEWLIANGYGIRESAIEDLAGTVADVQAHSARTQAEVAADKRKARLRAARKAEAASQAEEAERIAKLKASRAARLQNLAKQAILDEIAAAAQRTAVRIERARIK